MNNCVFWDFDGTLVFSDHLWSSGVFAVLKEYWGDGEVSFTTVRNHMRTGFTWHTPHEDYSRMTGDLWWEFMFRRFAFIYECFGVPKGRAAEMARAVRGEILELSKYHLYDDTISTLKKASAKGYRNFILSNNYPELPEIADGLGLTPLVDGIVVSSVVGYDKPRKELFAHALALAGEPETPFMVGDNPVADVAGGKNAGMTTVLVHKNTPCGSDYQFETLAEILDVL